MNRKLKKLEISLVGLTYYYLVLVLQCAWQDQRHIADDVRKQLVDNHAVGEALGQYCDIEGKLIYSTNNIGLSLPDVVKVPNVIAVAGGQEKSECYYRCDASLSKGILIIDEQAAEGCVNCYKFLPYRRISSYKF